MVVEQLPDQVREFANYLSGLMKRLDQDGGWCAVFWQRDPDGMRACLDGWEVPPWDVVESLLQDLTAEQGPQIAAQEAQRARSLHGASLAAYDGRPGGRDALGDRLDVMLREQRYATERQAELSRQLQTATIHEEADAVRLDLAWAHDDHERATARCVELRHRMENLDRRALRTHASGAFDFSGGAGGGVVRVAPPDPAPPVPGRTIRRPPDPPEATRQPPVPVRTTRQVPAPVLVPVPVPVPPSARAPNPPRLPPPSPNSAPGVAPAAAPASPG